MRIRRSPSRTPTSVAVICLVSLVGLVGLSACAGADTSHDASADSSGSSVNGGKAGAGSEQQAFAPGAGTAERSNADSSTSNSAADVPSLQDANGSKPSDSSQPALLDSSAMIKTGAVALESDDIGHVLAEVYGVVGGVGGDISKEDTSTDAQGNAVRSILVLRVPVDDFDTTLLQLSKLGTLLHRVSNAKDVTTEVADINSRVQSAQRSITTLRQLFGRATKLTDIIRLESELSQRESDLESLEAQQRSLNDKTRMSTITMTMELPAITPKPQPKPKDDDRAGGFVSGIHQGWDALKKTGLAVGHGLGVVLPLGTLALLLAAIVYWFVRRFSPHSASSPKETAEA